MKHKLHHRLTALLCALVLTLTLAPAARAAGTPAVSDNWMAARLRGYEWSQQVESFLYANPSGGLTRVEYIKGDSMKTLVVEDYSSAFQLQSSRTIPIELDVFYGFYAGSQYNYVIFIDGNKTESDSVEVLRVVKYDKSWNRLGQASVYGANTSTWSTGTVSCEEVGGMLYIHASHIMYKSSDGLTHQANIAVAVRTSDMTVTDQNYTIGGYPFYVSHSLNQFVFADQEGNLILANYGDAHPRALVMHKLAGKAGSETLNDAQVTKVQYEKLGLANSAVATSMGDVAETSTGYIMAFMQNKDLFPGNANQLYLSYISKADFAGGASFQTKALTSYGNSSPDAAMATLVPTSLNGGYILWNRVDFDHKELWTCEGFAYAAYNADGSVGEIMTLPDVPLSDCHPIVYNGKIVWYTTHDSAPVFYTLDANGVTATPANGTTQAVTALDTSAPVVSALAFPDVPTTHWAYKEIQACVANGAVTGYTDGTFRPDDPITVPQFMLMLERVYYPELLAAQQNNPIKAGKPWYYYVYKAAQTCPIDYRLEIDWENDYINAKDTPLTRFDMAMMATNVAKGHTEYINADVYELSISAISDYSSSWPIPGKEGVPYCLYTGIMTGMPDGTFSGEKIVTRAQACAVLNRIAEYIAPYMN